MAKLTSGICQVILLSLDAIFQSLRLSPGRRYLGLHLLTAHIRRHFGDRRPTGRWMESKR